MMVSKLDRISTVVDVSLRIRGQWVSKLDRISTVVDNRCSTIVQQFPSLIEFLLL